jgi:hypothetical protein
MDNAHRQLVLGAHRFRRPRGIADATGWTELGIVKELHRAMHRKSSAGSVYDADFAHHPSTVVATQRRFEVRDASHRFFGAKPNRIYSSVHYQSGWPLSTGKLKVLGGTEWSF